jgi:hypothetical protein
MPREYCFPTYGSGSDADECLRDGRGTVDCVQSELDGDAHIRLRPDPAYQRLLTAANAFQQCPNEKDPHLVVEIIPQLGHDGFKDNSATKGGFLTPLAPVAGQHVTVTGPLVWDTNLLHDLVYPGHDVRDWAEIHPAWNVTIDHPLPARAEAATRAVTGDPERGSGSVGFPRIGSGSKCDQGVV